MASPLTDRQRAILATAAGRPDRSVLPLPRSLRLNAGARALVLKSLIGRGLVVERPADRFEEAWRHGAEGNRLALVVTDAGLSAIGIEPAETEGPDRDGRPEPGPRAATTVGSAPAPRPLTPGTKLARVAELLSRPEGASLAELMAATGWQAHSVRGALAGTLRRHHGLEVTSSPEEGRGRVYRVLADAPEATR